MLKRYFSAAFGAFILGVAACASFDVTNPNQATLDDLLANPTRAKLSAAATGLFSRSRSEITSLIWRLGSMGREGINLAGNNQPDYQEPYFGPLSPSGFGGALWQSRYGLIRDANTYIDAASRSGDLSSGEKAVGQALHEGGDLSVEVLLRRSLRNLSKG